MNKYILIVVFGLWAFLMGASLGYFKGKTSVHIEIYQQQILELKNQLSAKDKSHEIDIKSLQSYHVELDNYKIKNNKLKEELRNAKDHINSTNTITSEWVQYVSRGTAQLSQISESSSRTDAESTPVDAYNVANGVINNFETCNQNAIQLNNLIDWINNQITTFNK